MLSYKFRITNVTKNRTAMLIVYVFGGLAVLALTALIASAVLMSQSDPGSGVSLGAFISLIISAAISGLGVARLSGGEPGISMIANLIISIILLALGLILGGGTAGLMNSVCYLGISALAALLGKRRKRRPRRR